MMRAWARLESACDGTLRGGRWLGGDDAGANYHVSAHHVTLACVWMQDQGRGFESIRNRNSIDILCAEDGALPYIYFSSRACQQSTIRAS
eukprot:364930-Chlamydomonas_euryale.AAC.18